MRLICLSLTLVFLLSSVIVSAEVQRGKVPDGMMLGITAPGGPPEDDGDDVSMPDALKNKLMFSSGVNMVHVGADWNNIEPKDPGDGPSNYRWDDFDKQFIKIPKGMNMMLGFGIGTDWVPYFIDGSGRVQTRKDAKIQMDKDRYWKLAERWITAVSKRAHDKGVRYFHVPGNEPSLSMEQDWHWKYMDMVKHFYKAIKAGNPDNQVVIGSLVVGDWGHVGALYVAGAKGNYDVMDIHAYGDSKQHVDMNQIIATHAEMVKNGDGDKKIFLGEGWSCFPLPKHLDKLNPKSKKPVYTPEDIEHYRETVLHGWRNLITPRDDYDPKWVLGAKYFTMNDFWGGKHWLERAIEHKNEKGEIEYWMLDGYKINYKPGELDPSYRPWGLVDADGNPKGTLLAEFPPYIPQAQITGKMISDKAEPGKTCVVRLTVKNGEKEPFTNIKWGMYSKGNNWIKEKEENRDKIQFLDLDQSPTPDLKTGASITHDFEVTIPAELAGQTVKVYGELWYKWKGRQYYTDAWVTFKVEK